jgi:hypothetical protein
MTMQEDKQKLESTAERGAARSPRRRTVFWILGGLVLIALLAGAASIAGRLMAGESLLPSPDIVVGQDTDFGLLPPTQVPDRSSDLEGPFQRREDNSLFVARAAGGGPDGPVDAAGGPTTEVVVTHDTLIYADITSPPSPGDVLEGGMLRLQAQQVDNIEEIGEGTVLRVWGEWQGDRLIATVIYYDQQ